MRRISLHEPVRDGLEVSHLRLRRHSRRQPFIDPENHRIVFSEFRPPAPLPAHCLGLVGKSLDVILAELAGPTPPSSKWLKPTTSLAKIKGRPLFAERPFDGVDTLLHEPSRVADTALGIATGHRTDTIAPALQTLRWAEFFEPYGGGHGTFEPPSRDASSGARGYRGGGQRCAFHR